MGGDWSVALGAIAGGMKAARSISVTFAFVKTNLLTGRNSRGVVAEVTGAAEHDAKVDEEEEEEVLVPCGGGGGGMSRHPSM